MSDAKLDEFRAPKRCKQLSGLKNLPKPIFGVEKFSKKASNETSLNTTEKFSLYNHKNTQFVQTTDLSTVGGNKNEKLAPQYPRNIIECSSQLTSEKVITLNNQDVILKDVRTTCPRKAISENSAFLSSVFQSTFLPFSLKTPFPKNMVSPKRRRYNSEVRSCSLHLSTIPKSPHKLSTPIGKGSFGHVFKARYKENQQWFAIKRSNKPFGGPGDRQLQMNEVNFLRTLGNHPHCVRYDRAWEENGVLYIQTELCQGGTLQKFLEENINISEDQIWHFITDLTLGLKHIHDNNIVHLDIKPANIFLSFEHDKKLNSSNSSEFFNLKIGDYGIAFDITQKSRFDYQEGDNKYMAPELLAGQFGTPADIFSLGITILEIVGDYELPSAGLNWSKLRNEWQPELPSQYSDSLKNLIAEMMRRDPLKRPTVEAILRHPCVRRALRCRCRRSSTFQAISSAYMCLAEIVRKLPEAFYCSSLFLAKSLFRLSVLDFFCNI
ncbi:hypothetical protein Zmor_012399 [Zophobas morio]|uniref:non-specific serine/threonine protein kinase n=1 Tax=Zophobas morio TaxID=2755281 RepID=A0AA38HIL6_9CUCU|nr:hypothetical protein Zmor_012399 [Zophobas morio]